MPGLWVPISTGTGTTAQWQSPPLPDSHGRISLSSSACTDTGFRSPRPPSPQPPQLCQLGKCFCFLLSPSQGSWPFGCISLRSLAYGFCLIVYLFYIYSPHFCGSKVLQMASSLQTVFSPSNGLHGLAFLPHLCPSPSCQLYSSYTLWKCSGRHQEYLLLRNYWSFLCLECFNPGYLCIYSLTSFGWHSMKCQFIYEAFSELHMN